MTRHPDIIRQVRRSAGVGIVTAIFLLVVLAGLGAALVSVYTSEQQGASLDELGARAYQAARAGVEWGLYQQMVNNSCPATASTFALTGGTLAGFTATVSCTQVGVTGDPLTRWVIKSSACNQPGTDGACPNAHPSSPDYVARQVEVQI